MNIRESFEKNLVWENDSLPKKRNKNSHVWG
jgi:hypothetical protein